MTQELFPDQDLGQCRPARTVRPATARPARRRAPRVETVPMFAGHPRHKRRKGRESMTVYEAVLLLRRAGCHVYCAGAGKHRVGSAVVNDLGLIDIAIGELEAAHA